MSQSQGAQAILNPKHPLIKDFYAAREILARENLKNETSIRAPFANLLREVAKLRQWTYIDEVSTVSTTAAAKPLCALAFPALLSTIACKVLRWLANLACTIFFATANAGWSVPESRSWAWRSRAN